MAPPTCGCELALLPSCAILVDVQTTYLPTGSYTVSQGLPFLQNWVLPPYLTGDPFYGDSCAGTLNTGVLYVAPSGRPKLLATDARGSNITVAPGVPNQFTITFDRVVRLGQAGKRLMVLPYNGRPAACSLGCAAFVVGTSLGPANMTTVVVDGVSVSRITISVLLRPAQTYVGSLSCQSR